MNLDELCTKLDLFFNVHTFNESDGWDFAMPDSYMGMFKRFVRPSFVEGSWNGLMLDNRNEKADVDRIYLVVFPNQDVIDTIIAQEVERQAPGAMIFAHHLMGFSERELRFNPLVAEQLEELQEHHISFYNCHAPLDCHPEISTGNALANALGLDEQERFFEYYGGLAGVHGKILPMTFQKFAEKLADVCEIETLRYDQCRHNGRMVEHVALIPGGGDDPEEMRKAEELGADTYVTGHWWLFGDSEFAQERREKAPEVINKLSLNLLAGSHYSTELIVMRDQMVDWFQDLGLETVLLRQQDPWR